MLARCTILAALCGEGFFLVESTKVLKTDPPTCPTGYTQLGVYGADVPGCGIDLGGPTDTTICPKAGSVDQDSCASACTAETLCGSFEWNDKNKVKARCALNSWAESEEGPCAPNSCALPGSAKKQTGKWDAVLTCKKSPSATATGDPHLTNIRGKKFDIHDGSHRLVHIPRGASEAEALLKIDAHATMMPGQKSCYNVYFTSARISGKWVGNDVLVQHNNAPMGKKQFLLGFGGKFHEWSELVRHASKLNFSGIEPVKVSTKLRTASRDAPGGRDIQLRIGHRNPVLVQIWASKGSNELSGEVDIQYMNLEVSNLPQNTGGLLGLDTYNRPAGSRCGLTKQDGGAIRSIGDLVLLDLNNTHRLHWRMSAHMRE